MSPVATEMAAGCGNCGSDNSWVLHNVWLRDMYRCLCTSCVLQLHRSSFCPSCFTLYDSIPSLPSECLSCSNCPSLTHSECAPSSSSTPYLCPPCKDSKVCFFDVMGNKKSNGVGVIDKKLADELLCASKIASASMEKAVKIAGAEAERRAREAVVARKRAREALEQVALVSCKENRKLVVKEDKGMGKRKCGIEYGNGDGARKRMVVGVGLKREDVSWK